MYKILSIDGGGIRGIIPARVLEALEAELQQPLWRVFDLIIGNSTGSIIAMGLSKPKPLSAAELRQLYLERGPDIFGDKQRVYLNARYNAAPLENILKETFEDNYLGQCMTQAMAVSYNLETRSPHFFKSQKALDDTDYNYYLRDVVRASAAAPTYFAPIEITSQWGNKFPLIDGGVVANNPGMVAYTEAVSFQGIPSDQVLMVSVGTGAPRNSPIYCKKAATWGLLSWAKTIVDITMDGPEEATEQFLQMLLPAQDGAIRYHRLQVDLPAGTEAIDNASVDNMARLVQEGEKIILTEAFQTLCKTLKGLPFAHPE